MEIIPAILPKNFAELSEKISQVVGLSKIVQVDICDGKYTPHPTWPYYKHDENFEKILREEEGMPEWKSVNYEFDLMIDNPTPDDVGKWLSAGAQSIILHMDSSPDLTPVLENLNGLVEVGLALNQNSDLNKLEKYIDKIQYVQFMGIRKAGFQGQKFENHTLDKIKEFKNKYPNIKVQVDGGVNLENASFLRDVGADSLVVGSALFESDNIVDTYDKFKAI